MVNITWSLFCCAKFRVKTSHKVLCCHSQLFCTNTKYAFIFYLSASIWAWKVDWKIVNVMKYAQQVGIIICWPYLKLARLKMSHLNSKRQQGSKHSNNTTSTTIKPSNIDQNLIPLKNSSSDNTDQSTLLKTIQGFDTF